MNFQIEKGVKYQAAVKLGFLDRLASNEQVENKFKSVGFINVVSTGSGKERTVIGIWNGETKAVSLPEQIESVIRV